MSDWQPSPGATVLIPSGPTGQHLFVVLNSPRVIDSYGPHPQILMVNLSTVRETLPYDDACVLEAGAHPFIRHRSFAYYRDVRIEPAQTVALRVRQSLWRTHENATGEVLERLQRGLLNSRFTRRELKKLRLW